MDNEIIDNSRDEETTEHEFLISWNRIELKGLFAWGFLIHMTMAFIRGLFHLITDILFLM